MIIDNFELFETYILNYETDNIGDPYIYQIDLIERKKDGVKTSGANNSARRIASFYPENKEQWEKYKHRIQDMCNDRPGLRAYINPSRKRASKVLLELNVQVAQRLYHKAYTGQNKLYPSAVATCKAYREDSIWILDIDSDDSFSADDILKYFDEFEKNPVITVLPSKSGQHILTRPFDKEIFDKWLADKYTPKESIIKINSLTNLYINILDNEQTK